MISKDFDILKKNKIPGHVTKWNPPFFGFDSETVIGDGFTRFANPVSVSFVKQAVSLKPKLEPISVSTNGSRPSTLCLRLSVQCVQSANCLEKESMIK